MENTKTRYVKTNGEIYETFDNPSREMRDFTASIRDTVQSMRSEEEEYFQNMRDEDEQYAREELERVRREYPNGCSQHGFEEDFECDECCGMWCSMDQ